MSRTRALRSRWRCCSSPSRSSSVPCSPCCTCWIPRWRPRRAAWAPAGWTLFRHIVLPQLLPAVVSGAALAFARALGEYGAVVLLSGNIPFQTQLASVYIFGDVEQGDTADAAAISLVLLLLTLAVLVAADIFRRRYTAHAQ